MKNNRYWFALTGANILLLALSSMLNDGVAGWNVSLLLCGPCVVWPALRLRTTTLLGCLLISGLVADALLPTPPGFFMSLLVAGAMAVITVRPWLGRVTRAQQLMLAWLLNGGYFIAFTVWAVASQGASGSAFWERVAVDFCLSQIIVVPVSIWFFDFQESVLSLAGLTVSPLPAAEAY